MQKSLERDLGLFATLTISIGAMIGSGIFVLPGLATKIAGPGAILAYFLAGVVVLPAALSKSEMATAMPEAGGTYLYIDRAMGPLPGTVAGVGAWFSLVFKSAFALVGLGAYLLIFVPRIAGVIKLVALGLGLLLLGVNVVGVKQSGRLQATIVTLVLLSLVLFIGDGLTVVDSARYRPLLTHGSGGLLAATGFVFVSYAGVTKIASVAEEVENPGRNIPIGILGSVGLMMLVYPLTVYVVVGVAPTDQLVAPDMLTPMSLAAGQTLGRVGEVAVAVVAVLALTSMANAGILSSSRFPLAMSRDDLAPARFAEVDERFRTPTFAIALTGVVLLGLVALVPVIQLAKLASAFKILVFMLVNAALVAFRESDLRSYDPEFVTPGYPWVQLFGIAAGLLLLTQMGPLPLVGAVGIVLAGLLWYAVYGRERTEREGAAVQAILQGSTDRALDRTRAECAEDAPRRVLVPVAEDPTETAREAPIVHMAADLAGASDGEVHVVGFEEVPEQLSLGTAADDVPDDVAVSGGSGERLPGGGAAESAAIPSAEADPDAAVPSNVSVGQVVTHDAKESVASYAATHDVDLVVGEWHPSRWHAELLGADVDWYMRHLPCDVTFVRSRGYDGVDEIALVADAGPYDPLEVVVADALAVATGASVRFVSTVDESAGPDRAETAEAYLRELATFCDAESTYEVVRTDGQVAGLEDALTGSDLVIIGTSAHHVVYEVLFGTVPDQLVQRLDSTVLLTHAYQPLRHTFIRVVLDRFVF